MMKRNLDKRLPLTHSVKMATLLDPSTRALLQLSDDVMEDMLYAATAAYVGIQVYSSLCHLNLHVRNSMLGPFA